MASPDGSVSASGTNYIDGLLWGVRWMTSSSNNPTITYYARNDFQTWNSAETTAPQNALQTWANVANVTFSPLNSTSADLGAYKLSDAQMTSLMGGPEFPGVFVPPDTSDPWWRHGALNIQQAGEKPESEYGLRFPCPPTLLTGG